MMHIIMYRSTELICCDKCDKVYHGSCLKVDDVNTLPDPWHCPACAPGSDENNKVAAVKTEEEEEPMAMAVKSEEQDDGEGHNDENEVLGVLGTRKKRKTGCNDDQCYICESSLVSTRYLTTHMEEKGISNAMLLLN